MGVPLLFPSPARLMSRQFGGAAERSPSVRSERSVSEVEDPGPARFRSPGGCRRAPPPAFTAARPTGQPQGVAPTIGITVDRDEDGVWIVECPTIPGCVSQGKTKGEALDNIKEAIALCLEVRAEKGLPLTVETQQIEVTV